MVMTMTKMKRIANKLRQPNQREQRNKRKTKMPNWNERKSVHFEWRPLERSVEGWRGWRGGGWRGVASVHRPYKVVGNGNGEGEGASE